MLYLECYQALEKALAGAAIATTLLNKVADVQMLLARYARLQFPKS
jgi:hypothetical protein